MSDISVVESNFFSPRSWYVIHFTKKQVFEALCFDFPHENITYEEISCLDTVNHCNSCAHSSDIHTIITAFIQSLYDSVIKPQYYNPQAISDIGCRGISGTSRFFKANAKANVDDASVSKSYNKNAWFWKGNYSEGGRSQTKENGGFVQTQMSNLSKTSRECCNEQGLERVSSCTAGCSIMWWMDGWMDDRWQYRIDRELRQFGYRIIFYFILFILPHNIIIKSN